MAKERSEKGNPQLPLQNRGAPGDYTAAGTCPHGFHHNSSLAEEEPEASFLHLPVWELTRPLEPQGATAFAIYRYGGQFDLVTPWQVRYPEPGLRSKAAQHSLPGL